jgi:hypothetical protein
MGLGGYIAYDMVRGHARSYRNAIRSYNNHSTPARPVPVEAETVTGVLLAGALVIVGALVGALVGAINSDPVVACAMLGMIMAWGVAWVFLMILAVSDTCWNWIVALTDRRLSRPTGEHAPQGTPSVRRPKQTWHEFAEQAGVEAEAALMAKVAEYRAALAAEQDD